MLFSLLVLLAGATALAVDPPASVGEVWPHAYQVHAGHEGNAWQETHGSDEGPPKCFTPLWMAYQQHPGSAPVSVMQKRALFEADETTSLQSHISESGRFRIVYSTEGTAAVPAADETGSGVPDYVELTARFADESFHKQVTELGFVDPTVHQGSECGNRIGAWQDTLITIRYHSARYYGAFFSSNPFAFVVHHNFEGFPSNTDPEGHVHGALRATIAHELKHVIQYATNCMRGDAGNGSWLEMDATMMENVVYPQVNDYYNYISASFSLLRDPGVRIPAPSVSHSYSHVTWSLFYAEDQGMSFWVDTWEQIRENHLLSFTEAMKRSLRGVGGSERDQEFARLLARNHLWHLASGRLSRADYGFSEAAYYPDATIAGGTQPFTEPYFSDRELKSLSADRRMFRPSAGQIGPMEFTFTPSHPSASVGVLAWRSDGSVTEWLPDIRGDKPSLHVSPFALATVDSFAVVIANADRNAFLSYELVLDVVPIPKVVTLLPNYPNPFGAAAHGSVTSLVFTVPSPEHVRLTVYDVTGRRVAVLLDEQVDIGRHTVPFQAVGLASGVYIYRLKTGAGSRTGKMTYIR